MGRTALSLQGMWKPYKQTDQTDFSLTSVHTINSPCTVQF